MSSLDLSQWFAAPGGAPVEGIYDPTLVGLSIVLAVVASWVALRIIAVAPKMREVPARALLLLTASLVLGGGVWAMHFVGMLAFALCTQVSYDPGVTMLSILPSILASAVALTFIAQERRSAWQLPVSGMLVGLGIGAMHYSGMAAMRMNLTLRYDPGMFAVSIVVAVALATLALWLRFGHSGRSLQAEQPLNVLLSALVLGCAIAGMHYVGMASARFSGAPDPDFKPGGYNSFLALAVSLTALALAAVAGMTATLVRYRLLLTRLQRSDARAHALLAAAVDGVIRLDADGRIEECNAAVERLFGCETRHMLGRSIRDFIPDIGDLHRHLGEASEQTGLRVDGSLVPLRLSVAETRLPGEHFFVVYLSDLTERLALEEARLRSEAQYRALVRNMPGAAYRYGLEPPFELSFVGDGLLRISGYRPADLQLPKPLQDFVDFMFADDLPAALGTALKGIETDGGYALEFRMRHRDGSPRWVWTAGSIARDERGAPRWIDGVMLDMTERHRYELDLQVFRTIVASSEDAIISKDLRGIIKSWNQGAAQVFGYSAEEAIGKPMLMMFPEGREDEERDILERISKGQSVRHFDTIRRRKDGSLIHVSVTISPMHDEHGVVVGASKIARDVTARYRMEVALREAKEKAERAAAARTAFVANMSHEIRTPMNAILGFTDVLLGTELDSSQRRHLETVRRSAHSLLRLLDEVLDVAKLDRAALHLHRTDFNLLGLIDEMSSTWGAAARAKGLQMFVNYAPELPSRFNGDELRIRQVIGNLLGNAVKFTESGEINLEIQPVDGMIGFRVRDTGIGIDPSRLSAIFEPFTQADASITRRFGGTGLGTTICKQLVELMGGRIWVESHPGQGSSFEFVLPLEAAHEPVAERSAPQPALGRCRVLVVDDMTQNRELLEILLQRLGHEVLSAADGAEALSMATARQDLDLILMDVHMPGMDGLAATRRLRSRERQAGLRAVPIIALTASVMLEDRLEAREAGMDGFVAKPIEPEALEAEMARVLEAVIKRAPVGVRAGNADRVFDQEAGLRRWAGDLRAYRRALERWRGDIGPLSGQFDALTQQHQWGELRNEAHRVRGLAANLGFVELSTLLAEVERDVVTEEYDAVRARLAPLRAALERVLAALESTLSAVHAAAFVPPQRVAESSFEQAREAGIALMQALSRGSLDDQALNRFVDSAPPMPEVPELIRALEDFEMDTARELLGRMLGRIDARLTGARPWE
jgi:PAS domain S-box-containing protein